jgi:arginase
MGTQNLDIQILAAPSILGLRTNGVQDLPAALLKAGLGWQLQQEHPVLHLATLNAQYSDKRDPDTRCLNPVSIRNFSIKLGKAVDLLLDKGRFPLILGGDCSILLGIMSGLKVRGKYGLIFIDAHADFYEPEKSVTGEVADMDLAIVTGRGPDILTNINNIKPYVEDGHVIHIGQRDWEETKKYGSQDIRDTTITRYDLENIEKEGIEQVAAAVITNLDSSLDGYWMHFDTDVLADELNPAVEYHLPGGLDFEQSEYFINQLLCTGRIIGFDITIFNPRFDTNGQIAQNISDTIVRAFRSMKR